MAGAKEVCTGDLFRGGYTCTRIHSEVRRHWKDARAFFQFFRVATRQIEYATNDDKLSIPEHFRISEGGASTRAILCWPLLLLPK